MLKIGVLGTGHLGKIHLKCIKQADTHYALQGFYDADASTRAKVSADFGTPAFDSMEALIEAVDVVDIVTPTTTHFELAKKAILKGKHVFVEKPLTNTPAEAKALLELSRAHGVKIQVGHVERFNPALLALGEMELAPMFIEAHRLATFNPRGTDVSVVLDLMIHDLDILLSMVDSPVKVVNASGVAVVSDTPDIANARIEFANGCVANLTASRISLKQMRKIRLFQQDAYISLDFLDKEAQVVRLYGTEDPDLPPNAAGMTIDTNRGTKHIHIDMPSIANTNAIQMELQTFAESITQDQRPLVSGEDGYQALKLAYDIMAEIDRRTADL
ncbi:MAG: Gfo/Idh/MocA family oxidoreductase [Saprospiraceae bacterium]|nr:Gfo/Idh/MocA family oxidoreductase [Saprospiraceae bacterium]